MITEQLNSIPNDYGVTLVFRHFERTWIHQGFMSVGCKNEFYDSMGSIAWMQYSHKSGEMLYDWLSGRWPKPIPSAQWNHERKSVEVFADLFLCPECGNFYVLEMDGQARERVRGLIQHPKKDIGIGSFSFDWSRLDPSDADRLRSFAASRLNAPQFYMELHGSPNCEKIKLRVIRKFKAESRGTEEQLSPETLAFLEAKKQPKPAPCYTSSIYLIHGSGHQKIGIAIDANNRLKSIQTSCPFPVEILKTWKSENAQTVERAMHRRFAAHRLNGEWFKLPESILAMLSGIEDIDSEFLQ